MSIHTLGSKNPIEKFFDVVSVSLDHRYYPNSKIQTEALVTNEITCSDIQPPESKEIIKNEKIKNLTLADCSDCKESTSLLIDTNYYHNLFAGKIIHLNKNFVAVESIFEWCLQSRNSENDSALS